VRPARLLIPFIKKVCAPPRQNERVSPSEWGRQHKAAPPAAASIKSASISEHFKNTLAAAAEMRKLNL
jgi:hypothetical protein